MNNDLIKIENIRIHEQNMTVIDTIGIDTIRMDTIFLASAKKVIIKIMSQKL